MRSIVSFTARSLPGIGRGGEDHRVARACSSTCGWSPCAIRRSADSGSPWLPVEITTSLWSGKSSISRTRHQHPLGDLDVAERAPDVHVLAHRAARPATTLRPSAAAASTTCCTRWMFEAKQVTRSRARRSATSACSRCGPTLDSDVGHAGRSTLVESPQSSSSPSRPSSARRADVGRDAVDRRLVELVVAA